MDKTTRTKLARLADTPRAHKDLGSDGRKARNAALYEAYAAGGSTLRELADASGLSTSQVHKILIQETAERQVVHVAGAAGEQGGG